jgi:uncharacterized protein
MNPKDYHFRFLNQNLFLHPYGGLYWEEKRALLVADLHLGKAAHFRKAGIPVPVNVHEGDLDRLQALLENYRPSRCIVLGDLFHSEMNSEWHMFVRIVRSAPKTAFELVPGNHDIFAQSEYAILRLHEKQHLEDPFLLSHEPVAEADEAPGYNVCGHLHPAISLPIGPRMSRRADCFWFGRRHGILPAFGGFTGRGTLSFQAATDASVFIIADQEVFPLTPHR